MQSKTISAEPFGKCAHVGGTLKHLSESLADARGEATRGVDEAAFEVRTNTWNPVSPSICLDLHGGCCLQMTRMCL